jgi:hypothetical protein
MDFKLNHEILVFYNLDFLNFIAVLADGVGSIENYLLFLRGNLNPLPPLVFA